MFPAQVTKASVIVQGVVVLVTVTFVNLFLIAYFHIEHVPFWMLSVMTLTWALTGVLFGALTIQWNNIKPSVTYQSTTEPTSSPDQLSGYDGWMSEEDRPKFDPSPDMDDENGNDWEEAQ